jgi:hypothetical protein
MNPMKKKIVAWWIIICMRAFMEVCKISFREVFSFKGKPKRPSSESKQDRPGSMEVSDRVGNVMVTAGVNN